MREKYNFIEIIRICAAFLVIVNHTNSEIFLGCGISPTWFISLAYFFISKMAVPLFIMISGYLMLGKVDDYSKCLKRFARMVAVIIVFSLPYYINNLGGATFSISEYFNGILGKPATNAFWYLYFYAAVLLMMPFLQKFFNALEKKDIQILVSMSALLYMIWPIVIHYFPNLEIQRTFRLPICEVNIALIMLGGYFKKYGVPKIHTAFYALGFVGAVMYNVIATYFEYQVNSGWYLFYDNKEYFPIIVQTVCFFAICSRIQLKGTCSKIVETIGGCTFGIYLLSDLFIEKLKPVWLYLESTNLYPVFAVVIFEIMIFGIGFMITWIIKRIPFLKTII